MLINLVVGRWSDDLVLATVVSLNATPREDTLRYGQFESNIFALIPISGLYLLLYDLSSISLLAQHNFM